MANTVSNTATVVGNTANGKFSAPVANLAAIISANGVNAHAVDVVIHVEEHKVLHEVNHEVNFLVNKVVTTVNDILGSIKGVLGSKPAANVTVSVTVANSTPVVANTK